MSPTSTLNPEKKICKQLSDEELIALILKGSVDKAVRCMYSKFWKACGVYRKFRLSEDDYVSIYSDAMLDLVVAIKKGKFEGRSGLKTFFCRILHNKAFDKTSKSKTKPIETDLDEGKEIKMTREESSVYDPGQERAVLKAALNRLYLQHERCWVLWDGRLAGFKWEEIAPKADYTPKAARQTFSNTCKKLLHALVVQESLRQLDSLCQEILKLKMSGKGFGEIAEEMGMQEAEIEMQYLLCRDKLRVILGNGGAWATIKGMEG